MFEKNFYGLEMHELFIKVSLLWSEHLPLYKKEYKGTPIPHATGVSAHVRICCANSRIPCFRYGTVSVRGMPIPHATGVSAHVRMCCELCRESSAMQSNKISPSYSNFLEAPRGMWIHILLLKGYFLNV